jgi:hypothetical protein
VDGSAHIEKSPAEDAEMPAGAVVQAALWHVESVTDCLEVRVHNHKRVLPRGHLNRIYTCIKHSNQTGTPPDVLVHFGLDSVLRPHGWARGG